MRPVESIGHNVLPTHSALVATLPLVVAFLTLLLLLVAGSRHTGDRHFERQNRFHGTAERELYRSAHLAGIDAGRENTSKGANVVEIIAHELSDALRLCV